MDAAPEGTTSYRVAVGTITDGNMRTEFVQSMWAASQEGVIGDWLIIPSGPYLDIGRNKTVDAYFQLNDLVVADGELQHDFLLFVDDDAATREGYAAHLATCGYDVRSVGTGGEALALAGTWAPWALACDSWLGLRVEL